MFVRVHEPSDAGVKGVQLMGRPPTNSLKRRTWRMPGLDALTAYSETFTLRCQSCPDMRTTESL